MRLPRNLNLEWMSHRTGNSDLGPSSPIVALSVNLIISNSPKNVTLMIGPVFGSTTALPRTNLVL